MSSSNLSIQINFDRRADKVVGLERLDISAMRNYGTIEEARTGTGRCLDLIAAMQDEVFEIEDRPAYARRVTNDMVAARDEEDEPATDPVYVEIALGMESAGRLWTAPDIPPTDLVDSTGRVRIPGDGQTEYQEPLVTMAEATAACPPCATEAHIETVEAPGPAPIKMFTGVCNGEDPFCPDCAVCDTRLAPKDEQASERGGVTATPDTTPQVVAAESTVYCPTCKTALEKKSNGVRFCRTCWAAKSSAMWAKKRADEAAVASAPEPVNEPAGVETPVVIEEIVPPVTKSKPKSAGKQPEMARIGTVIDDLKSRLTSPPSTAAAVSPRMPATSAVPVLHRGDGVPDDTWNSKAVQSAIKAGLEHPGFTRKGAFVVVKEGAAYLAKHIMAVSTHDKLVLKITKGDGNEWHAFPPEAEEPVVELWAEE